MKMVLVVVAKERVADMERVLQRCALAGYSLFPSVFGKGETGTHLGTRVFPGENVMFMALVNRLQFDGVVMALKDFGATLPPEDAFKVIGLDASVVI